MALLPDTSRPVGAAGGDLGGIFPVPTVEKIKGGAIPVNKALIGTNPAGQLIDATSTAVAGDLSGTVLAPVVEQIKGAAIPLSKEAVGTNATGQLIASLIVGRSAAMPAAGSYTANDIVLCDDATEYGGAGSMYTILGWRRITTGAAHVLNTDWFEMRTLTGN